MVQLEKPTFVSAGILGRTRTLPIRPAKSGRLAQRSLTVSIASRNSRNGSASVGGGGSSANSTARQLRATSINRCQQPEPQEQTQETQEQQCESPQQLPTPTPPGQQQQPGPASSLARRTRQLNSGASNSANSALGGGSESNTAEECSVQLPDGCALRSPEPGAAASTRRKKCLHHFDQQTTRSIMKMRRLSNELPLLSWHNSEAGTAAKGNGSPTLHQQREQKIFDQCRFIPTDTFYKKVIIAPNEDRQFFAAPKCSRVPGSNMLYDIVSQNPMHHRDVNFDMTRDSLRKVCSTFHRTSQFRHPGY
uniref:Bromo domain-containing protein n=1 Tax=Macrostomum lignano TaxID=282301 RepID=A0A1I8GGQ1_9PLAT